MTQKEVVALPVRPVGRGPGTGTYTPATHA